MPGDASGTHSLMAVMKISVDQCEMRQQYRRSFAFGMEKVCTRPIPLHRICLHTTYTHRCQKWAGGSVVDSFYLLSSADVNQHINRWCNTFTRDGPASSGFWRRKKWSDQRQIPNISDVFHVATGVSKSSMSTGYLKECHWAVLLILHQSYRIEMLYRTNYWIKSRNAFNFCEWKCWEM